MRALRGQRRAADRRRLRYCFSCTSVPAARTAAAARASPSARSYDAAVGRARQRPAPGGEQGVGAGALAGQPPVEVGIEGAEPFSTSPEADRVRRQREVEVDAAMRGDRAGQVAGAFERHAELVSEADRDRPDGRRGPGRRPRPRPRSGPAVRGSRPAAPAPRRRSRWARRPRPRRRPLRRSRDRPVRARPARGSSARDRRAATCRAPPTAAAARPSACRRCRR